MNQYRVMVPGFRWEGKEIPIGGFVESLDTIEARVNVTLGRLELVPELVTQIAIPQRIKPTVVEAPAAAGPRKLSIAELETLETKYHGPPPKPYYPRRDKR